MNETGIDKLVNAAHFILLAFKNYSFGDDSDQHQALNKIKDALKFIEDERLTYLVVENTDPIFEDME